jgi:hypothetical protein
VTKRDPNITEELKAISPAVANLDPTLPYTAPAGYFDCLPDQVLGRIREMENPQQEILGLSPLLAGLKGQTPFELPEGYFETVSDQVIRRAAETGNQKPEAETGKLVSMSAARNWTKLAAAAVITAVIAGSAWYFTRTSNEGSGATQELAATNGSVEVKDTLSVSDEALLSFLDETEALPVDDMILEDDSLTEQSLAILDLNENRIQEMLEEIPDSDLQEYVSSLPEDGISGSMN